MSESPVVRVQIFGSEYQIASQTDAEHTREVARYIDRKMREVANNLSLRSVSKIAVLTAVNLADELFKAQDEGQQMSQMANEKANKLARSVDQPIRE
ncbi:MAG: cell division protein ZapA [Candidatus Latescibacterota bacterium]|jgi:cell division protein ZapA